MSSVNSRGAAEGGREQERLLVSFGEFDVAQRQKEWKEEQLLVVYWGRDDVALPPLLLLLLHPPPADRRDEGF